MSKYTSEDVRNAHIASTTDQVASANGISADEWIRSMTSTSSEEAEWRERYLLGKEILIYAKIVSTDDRYEATNSTAYNMAADKLIARGCESPVIEIPFGFTGSRQMNGVIALRGKEKSNELR